MPTPVKKIELLRLRDVAYEIKLADAAVPNSGKVQIMRAGAYDHPWYGTMLITPNTLSDMVKNFDAKVRRQDLPVDYFHESDKEAAGWFTKLFTDANGQELWGEVSWTPKAQKMLADKEVRYFSADFAFEWTDPETAVTYKNVLFGGGLVNRPFIKDMQPVVELSEGVNQMKTVEQLNAEIAKLSETHAADIKKLGEVITAKDAEITELKGKVALAAKEKETAEKERAFSELCAKGKACAAQKDAYMAGDMAKFAELAQPLNVVPAGGEGGGGEPVTLSEEDKAMAKRLGLSEAEWIKYNK